MQRILVIGSPGSGKSPKLTDLAGTRIHLRSPAELRRFLATFDVRG